MDCHEGLESIEQYQESSIQLQSSSQCNDKNKDERVIPIAIVTSKGSKTSPDSNANHSHRSASSLPIPATLPVTLDDGSKAEASATITHFRSSNLNGKGTDTQEEQAVKKDARSNLNAESESSQLEIREIGEKTLERETCRGEGTLVSGINPAPIRYVPIKLDNGKVVQQADHPEETLEIRAEFTNYCHQEFEDPPIRPTPQPQPQNQHNCQDTKSARGRSATKSPSPAEPLEDIPRFDTANCSMAKNRDRGMEGGGGIVGRNPSRERVIPILVEDTGQTITPAFSRLDDPQPFTPFKSQKSSSDPAKSPPEEKVIPIRLADSEDLDDLDLEDNARASGPLKGGVDADLRSEYENHFSPLKQEPKRPAGSSVGTGARPKSTDSPTPTLNPEPKQPSTPAHPPSSLRKQRTNSTSTERTTTETTTKTTTEKRSQTVRFNIDNDHEEDDKSGALTSRASVSQQSSGKKRTPRSSSADSSTASRMKGLPPSGLGSRASAVQSGVSGGIGGGRDGIDVGPQHRGRTRTRSSGGGSYYRAFSASTPGQQGGGMNPPHTGGGGSHNMAAGSDDERALQEIDRDINRIWRELQELDKDLPPLKKPPQVPPNSSAPGSAQSKPKYERVKIQEYSIPKQSASPTRISSVPNNTANPSKTTSSYGGGTNEQSVKTSETTIPQTTASVPYGGKRTIWNMDSDQLHDDEVHPNYLTPNASRRHMGVTASTSNGAGSSLAGSGQKSGLVKPQWSTPATTQLEESLVRPNGDKKRRKSPERRRTSSLSKTATSATSSTNNGVSTTTVSVGTETGPPSQRNSFYDAREYTPPPLTVAPLALAGMLVNVIKDSCYY